MAMKVKGITIELSADTTGLEKALKGINKSLSDTQKDLKEVNKALNLDPKNLELVEQKQRLLTKAVDETTKKLKALKEAQNNLADRDSDVGQRQYDALTREISACEKKLKDLNKEQKEFNKAADDAKFSATGLGSALEKMSEGADKVAQKTAAISAAAAGALVGLGALVVKSSEFADEMLTTSQQTGLSTDTLQEMRYAAEGVDVPLETIVSSIRKMKGHLDDSSGVWDQIGVEVKDQKGEYRDIEDIFFDSVQALGEMENETQRDVVAMDLFGRSADDLAGILDDGGAKLRQLGQEAHDIGAIVSPEDLEALGEFNDKIEAMKMQLSAAGAQLAVPVLEALQPVIESVANAMTTLGQIISSLNPKFVQIAVIALTIIAAISPLAKLFSGLTSGIRMFTQVIPFAVTGIKALSAAFTAFVSNPYVLIIGLIIAALVALGLAIADVVKNWDTLSTGGDTMLTALRAGFESLSDKASSAAESIGSAFRGGFENVKSFASEFVDSVKSAMSKVGDALSKSGEFVGKVIDAFKSMVSRVTGFFNELIGKAKSAGANVLESFADGVKSVINSVIQAFKNLGQQIASVWATITGEAKQAGTQTAKAYTDGMNQGPRPVMSTPYTPYTTPPGGYGANQMYSSPNGAGSGELLGAINTLNSNLSRLGGGANINVELVGSAKNIFDTVRVQNSKLQTATGYHALA